MTTVEMKKLEALCATARELGQTLDRPNESPSLGGELHRIAALAAALAAYLEKPGHDRDAAGWLSYVLLDHIEALQEELEDYACGHNPENVQ